MPKAPRKSRSAGKKKRATPFESTAMDVDTAGEVEADIQQQQEKPDLEKTTAESAADEGDKTVSNHEIFRRHTEEWKKMKVRVADLKRQR